MTKVSPKIKHEKQPSKTNSQSRTSDNYKMATYLKQQNLKIISALTSNGEYNFSSKTLFNGTNFYKTQKYVLLTRQYVITNVKYVKQKYSLYQF